MSDTTDLMEETGSTYQIVLADGSVISGLRKNGDCFISDAEIDYDIFEDNCASVIVSDGTNTESFENMELLRVANVIDGEYWFAFRQMSASEVAQKQLQADIDYLAMMTDVEL